MTFAAITILFGLVAWLASERLAANRKLAALERAIGQLMVFHDKTKRR